MDVDSQASQQILQRMGPATCAPAMNSLLQDIADKMGSVPDADRRVLAKMLACTTTESPVLSYFPHPVAVQVKLFLDQDSKVAFTADL